MPRLVNKLPKYSLHKPSGQAKVRCGGKDTYLGKYGSPESKEAYARFVASIPKPAEQGRLAEPAPGVALMVGECIERYQAHAQRYYVHADGSQTGEALTIRVLLRPVVKKFAELPARDFGPKKLKQVREDLIAMGWTRYSINKSTSVTKRCFSWCASEELIPPQIAMGLKTVTGLMKNRTAAREKDPIGPVADEHVDAVLPIVSELVADICRLMRLTGMRPGEVLAMTADEIDRTDPTCWVYRPGQHKTSHKGKARSVMIGARAQEILSEIDRVSSESPQGGQAWTALPDDAARPSAGQFTAAANGRGFPTGIPTRSGTLLGLRSGQSTGSRRRSASLGTVTPT